MDPTDRGGQFCDRGQPVPHRDLLRGRRAEAGGRGVEARARGVGKLQKPIVTEIVPLEAFYPAEDYHQDFYKKSPVRYTTYRAGCGRDRRLEELWGQDAGHVGQRSGRGGATVAATGGGKGWMAVKDGSWTKPGKDELAKKLTPLQYKVTQQEATERAFAQRVLGQPRARPLRGRGLGGAAVLLARQVRLGHGLAELHPAAREGERGGEARRLARHAARRGALEARRFPPRPPLRRRPEAHGPPLLPQLGRAALHPRSTKLEQEGYGRVQRKLFGPEAPSQGSWAQPAVRRYPDVGSEPCRRPPPAHDARHAAPAGPGGRFGSMRLAAPRPALPRGPRARPAPSSGWTPSPPPTS